MVVTTQIYIYVKIYGKFVPKEKVHFTRIIKTSAEVIHYRLNKLDVKAGIFVFYLIVAFQGNAGCFSSVLPIN